MTFDGDKDLKRYQRVLHYIDNNLEKDLSVEKLSKLVAVSKFHFHRQLSGAMGISVYKYILLNRMKKASYQLAFRNDMQVIDVALDNGYEGPDSFSRAFKKLFQQTPSEFREHPQWDHWNLLFAQISKLWRERMQPFTPEQVQITTFKETRVAALEHHGAPHQLGNSIRKFMDWRKTHKLHPKKSRTFNIVYDDPKEVLPENFRFDICASINHDFQHALKDVVIKIIPEGRCAVLRHIGSDETLEECVRYLYSNWLPCSDEEPRDFPLFFERIRFYPDVKECDAITDVFLPLRDICEPQNKVRVGINLLPPNLEL